MAKKQFPDLNKDGKVTQADILQGRGVNKKKGMKRGGKTKSKMMSKGGAVSLAKIRAAAMKKGYKLVKK